MRRAWTSGSLLGQQVPTDPNVNSYDLSGAVLGIPILALLPCPVRGTRYRFF